MQRHTFHDIRPKGKRTEKSSRPVRVPKKNDTVLSREEKGLPIASSEPDFFSYVRGDGSVSGSKKNIAEKTLPRVSPRSRKPLFDPKEFTPVGGGARKGGSILWWIGTGIVIVLVIVLLGMFSGATVTMTPRQETVFIDNTFAAAEEIEEEGTQPVVPYQTMVLSVEKERDVPAAGEEEVAYRASGRIVVYNAYSGADQRLVKRTRFEDSDGRVYRIDESIVVPGMTEIDGEEIPGSIEVTVYADEPGEEYNIGLSDFTVPGFRDSGLTEQYEHFYGRSKTPMEGGFTGVVKVPEEKDLVAARASLELDITQALYEQLETSLPEGYRAVDGSQHIRFEHGDPMEIDNTTVRLTSKGFLQIAIVDERALAHFIAQQNVLEYSGEDVFFLDSEDVSVSSGSSLISSEESDEEQFTITLSGSAHIVWDIDTYAIRNDLLGVGRNMFDSEMRKYRDITDATASIRPFWKSTFPEEPDDIHIVQIIGGERVEK
ncbi:MAG: hypothetical protein H8D63_03050 [Parcubacteria group bacterium]|nr:hypothetical protein [Parcubacteria group bacterium]